MLRGRAVQNFTTMFLQLWTVEFGNEKYGYEQYLAEGGPGKYLSVPFGDSPYDSTARSANICISRSSINAKKYVYINTPYLIIDGEMKKALVFPPPIRAWTCAITVPHIPDKKYVFALTKAFYSPLVKEGVKIYQYTPGFIHAKSIVSDSRYAVIGSSNMDFLQFLSAFRVRRFNVRRRFLQTLRDDYLDTVKTANSSQRIR